MKTKILAYVPMLIIGGIIYYLSSLSDIPVLIEVQKNVPDYILHGIAYFVFGVCVVFGAWFRGVRKFRILFLEPALIIFVYGCLDEYHQLFVPYRDPSIRDVLADFVGGLLAVTFMMLILSIRQKKSFSLKTKAF